MQTRNEKYQQGIDEIWPYFDRYKAHCSNVEDARAILGWKETEKSSVYHYPDGHRELDVLLPANLYNRVAEVLGLPPKHGKSKRIAHGKRMAVVNKKHQFLRKSDLNRSP